MNNYYHIRQEVKPKELRLAQAEEVLMAKEDMMRANRKKLQVIEAKIKALQQNYENGQARKERLTKQKASMERKFERANKLLNELSGERGRWGDRVVTLASMLDNLIGDVILSVGTVVYLGALTKSFRARAIQAFKNHLADAAITYSYDFAVSNVLGDAATHRAWELAGLPGDLESLTNATILHESTRVPVIMDTEGYAARWFKTTSQIAGGSLSVTNVEDAEFRRKLQQCLSAGTSILVEGIDGFDANPVIVSLLKKQIVMLESGKGRSRDKKPHILVGEGQEPVLYNSAFAVYFTSVEDKPDYSASFYAKVNVVNFSLTLEALETQLLDNLTEKDDAASEARRRELMVSESELHTDLEDLEDKILLQLSLAQNDILDEFEVLNQLSELTSMSKQVSAEMKLVLDESKHVNAGRNRYRPVAQRVAMLFFCLTKLAGVSPMYCFGLRLFMGLFVQNAYADAQLPFEERLEVMTQRVFYAVYVTVCRSLFTRDQLLFSLLLCYTVHALGTLPEWKLFTEFKISDDVNLPAAGDTETPDTDGRPKWLPPDSWRALHRLGDLPIFRGICQSVTSDTNASKWKDVVSAAFGSTTTLPGWGHLSPLQTLCVQQCLCPQRLRDHVAAFVVQMLGEKYVSPPLYDLERSFDDSESNSAIIFITDAQSDPTNEVLDFASDRNIQCHVLPCPQSRDTGASAEALILDGLNRGCWIILQNCHLGPKWLSWLSRMLDTTPRHQFHTSFRIWLFTNPTTGFPTSMLANGVKVSYEPPNNIQASLKLSYESHRHAFIEKRPLHSEWTVIYQMCLLHAAMEERRNYGHLGWSNPHFSFGRADLRMALHLWQEFGVGRYGLLESVAHSGDDVAKIKNAAQANHILENFINAVAWCIYGGSVDAACDVERLRWAVQQSFHMGLDTHSSTAIVDLTDVKDDLSVPEFPILRQRRLKESHSQYDMQDFAPFAKYEMPTDAVDFTESGSYSFLGEWLPSVHSCEIYGISPSVDMIMKRADADALHANIVRAVQQPVDGVVSHAAANAEIAALVKALQTQLAHAPLDAAAIASGEYGCSKHSMTCKAVIAREVLHYDSLLATIHRSLDAIAEEFQTDETMSADLEQICSSLVRGKVPELWAAVSYPGSDKLDVWACDLVERLAFMRQWVEDGGAPAGCIWLGGLYCPESLGMSLISEYATANPMLASTDDQDLHVRCRYDLPQSEMLQISLQQAGAVAIRGLWLHGACWNATKGTLEEASTASGAALHSLLPMVLLEVCKSPSPPETELYICPVFARVTTPGNPVAEAEVMPSEALQSMNRDGGYLMSISIPTLPPWRRLHWQLRGVCASLSILS